jgi:ankyrin repeat protein/nucleoside phosphorylase
VPDRHSGLSDEDVSDIICILYPHSDPAGLEVQRLADENSPHVVRKLEVNAVDKLDDELEENAFEPKRTVWGDYAIILRLSSQVKDPSAGFVFGRNHSRCDVAFAHDPMKRISNMHFRIYPDENGSVIIEDQSTNGTLVDGRLLSSQETSASPAWVLSSGDMIQVFLHDPTQDLEFRVRIPRRNHEDQRDYLAKIREHPAWGLLAYPWDTDQSKLSLGSTSAIESKRRRSSSSEHGSSDEASSSAVARSVKRLKTLPMSQYTIAWICTSGLYLDVAKKMLDEVHAKPPTGAIDAKIYVLGSIGPHNVVIACPVMSSQLRDLPGRLPGLFRTIKLVLILGSGGGIPSPTHDIRLGDVVVGTRREVYSASDTEHLAPLAASVVGAFRARYESSNGREFESILDSQSKKHPDYKHPNLRDRLFRATYSHLVSGGAPSSMVADSRPANSDPFSSGGNMPGEASNCDHCDESQTVLRSVRTTQVPMVYFGGILSGPIIIKDAVLRDELAKNSSKICVDHWEAGKSSGIPWIHIRGICDYSDTHGNRGWQRFAALSAASLAKDLMADVPVAAPSIPSSKHVSVDYFLWKRRELLQSFKFERMDARFHNIKLALRKTCGWLPELPEYQQWLDFRGIEQHHGILWIRGKPGVGKSTIMKFAYTQMLRQQNSESSVVVSFFFNWRGGGLEKGMFGLYRSLLTQILEALPAFENLLDRPHIPWSREGSPCPSPDILKALLKDAVLKLGQSTLTCFIDALDECDSEEAEGIVSFFQDLSDTAVKEGIRLRICISSRHYPCIDSRTGISVTLEALDGHATDLSYYIRDKLQVNGDVHGLQHKVLEGSAGIFLWVVLIVDMLNKAHRQGRTVSLTMLSQASSPLADMWIDILRRSPTPTTAHELSTMWMLSAARPLNLHEYHHALWSGLKMNGLGADPPPGGNIDELEATAASSVVYFSKGLAEVTRGEGSTVQFIHKSVRSFLLEGDGLELWRGKDVIHAGKRHEFIKQCCSFYLSHEAEGRGKDQPSPRTRDFVLLGYAAHNILDHAECAAEMVDQQEFLAKFDMNEWLEAYNATEHDTTRQYDPGTPLIYVLADRGLPRLIRLWLKANSMVHVLRYPLLPKSHCRHPIFAALMSGNKEAVGALLGTSSTVVYGSDITEGFTDKTASHLTEFHAHTPLTWAAGRGLPGIVLWMLKCGVCVAELDEGGHTALSRACAGARIEVVQILLSRGAHPDRDAPNQEKPLVQAARHGHVKACQMMLDAGANLNALDKNGHTALSAACEEGRLGVVEYLLSFGRTLSLGDSGRRNPLVEACRSRRSDLIQLLLTHGAHVNSHDEEGWTPLKRAAEAGDAHVLRLLLVNRADVDFRGFGNSSSLRTMGSMLTLGKYSMRRDPSSFTPLMIATASGHLDAMRLLLASGAHVNTRCDNGLTPLVLAAGQGHDYVMTQLLLEYGADVNGQSEDGLTPLMFAAGGARTRVVELLVNYKADVNAVSHDGMSPLMFAAMEGRYTTVQSLLLQGADVNLNCIDGLSALKVAITGRHASVVWLLLNAGAYPNTGTYDESPPLWLAIRENLDDISQLLLENGADSNARNSRGMTPLIFAVQNGCGKIVELLLDAGADVEAANADGVSPLMIAVDMGQSVIVSRLLDRGAKFSATAQVGAVIDHRDIAAVLMAHEQYVPLAPTDSGYASTYIAEGKVESDDETGTVYSAASTSRSLDEESYIAELASQLTSGVTLLRLDDEINERILSILPSLLKDFALKVGHGKSVQMERDAMAFVHKHRK